MESLTGATYTFFVYMITGTMASLTSVLYHPDPVIGIGASGAIFGLFGAFTALVLKKKVMGADGRLLSFKSLLPPLIINFFISHMPEIDLSAHLSGFVVGALIGFIFK